MDTSLVPIVVIFVAWSSFLVASPLGDGNLAGEPAVHVHGSHEECPLPKSAQDVIACIKESHLSVKEARLKIKPADALIDKASQILNPEIESKVMGGSADGAFALQAEISVQQPLELGGKRKARIKEAEVQRKIAEREVTKLQAEVIADAAVKLHRLRQIDLQQGLLRENEAGFTELIRGLRSRMGLSPEQQVLVGIYEMAVADAKLKNAELESEERELGIFFHVHSGYGLDEIKKVVPKLPTSWPNLDDQASKLATSPRLTLASLNRDLAQATRDSEKAAAWPNLLIGPTYSYSGPGRNQEHLFGVQFSLPLPLWNRNAGGRLYGASLVSQTEAAYNLIEREQSLERLGQVQTYQAAVDAMKSHLSSSQIEKNYQQMRKLLPRGLIPSPLVIEIYRQRYELLLQRNTQEMKAINALWQVYKLDGRIFSESI